MVIEYINRALSLREPVRVRNRALDLVSLGRAHLLTGEAEHAAHTVAQVLPLLDGQRPGRVARKLADWQREAQSYTALPAVRDTCTAISDLTLAATR